MSEPQINEEEFRHTLSALWKTDDDGDCFSQDTTPRASPTEQPTQVETVAFLIFQ